MFNLQSRSCTDARLRWAGLLLLLPRSACYGRVEALWRVQEGQVSPTLLSLLLGELYRPTRTDR